MKLYVETRNKPPFDWNAALERAQKEGVSFEEYEEMLRLSQNWVTCACGNQCATIPRSISGAPMDKELLDNGTEFYYAIHHSRWSYALSILSAIEARSAVILSTLSSSPSSCTTPDI